MQQLQLKKCAGLPMYFKTTTMPKGERIINYTAINPGVIGDRLSIGLNEFEILEIKEQRPSPLDYGVSETVIFQSAVCRIITLEGNK